MITKKILKNPISLILFMNVAFLLKDNACIYAFTISFSFLAVFVLRNSLSRDVKFMKIIINKNSDYREVQKSTEALKKKTQNKKLFMLYMVISLIPLVCIVYGAGKIPYVPLKLLFFTTLIFVSFKMEWAFYDDKQKVRELLKKK